MCDSDAGVWTEEAYTDTYVHVCMIVMQGCGQRRPILIHMYMCVIVMQGCGQRRPILTCTCVCDSDAGVWTEEEAYKVYREKLVQLRDLYVGQFDHMSHVLQEKRRQFLLQWQYASRRRKPGTHIRGVMWDGIIIHEHHVDGKQAEFQTGVSSLVTFDPI